MKKTLKKFISIALAVAMIVSSLTYYHSDISAAQSDAAAYDWSGVSWLGVDGTGAAYANKIKVYSVSGASIVNIQTSFAPEVGIYLTFGDANFGNFELNGNVLTNNTNYSLQGAGAIIHLSSITEKYNDLVVYDGGGNQKAEVYIYYEDGEGGEPVTHPYDGMTLMTQGGENSTTTTNGWSYLCDANAEAYYTDNNSSFDMYIKTKPTEQWGLQLWAPSQSLTAGHTYTYTITFTSSKAGSLNTKDDVSNSTWTPQTVVAGANTLTGTFVAGATARAFMANMVGMDNDTMLSNIQVAYSEAETTTTTQAGSQYHPENVDWDSVAWIDCDSNKATYGGKYKYQKESNAINVGTIQTYNTFNGIYIYGVVADSVSLNGTTLDQDTDYVKNGDQIFLAPEVFTQRYNTLVFTSGGNEYVIYIYYAIESAWLNTSRNLAYIENGGTPGQSNTREGNISYLNDGIINTWDNRAEIQGNVNGYLEVNFDDVYDASSIDEVAVWMRSGDVNFYPTGGYTVQFLYEGIPTDVESITTYPNRNGCTGGADGNSFLVATTIDKANVSGKVDGVRIYKNTNAAYGWQVAELAVFAENPTDSVVLEKCDDPVGATVSSDNPYEISYTITPDEDQTTAGYKYAAYLDGTLVDYNLNPGVEYTISNITAGNHVVTIKSTCDGLDHSDGITRNVQVITPSGMFASLKNVSNTNNNASAQIISVDSFYNGHSLATAGAAIDGNTTTGEGTSVCLRTESGASATVVIDLGENYEKSQFEQLLLLHSNNRTYPGNVVVYFSDTDDNAEYEQVASKTYTYTDDLNINVIPVDVSDYTKTGVRYVKLALSGGSNAWGYVINEIATILNVNVEDAVIVRNYTDVPDDRWVTVGNFNLYSSANARKTSYSGTGAYNSMRARFTGAHSASGDSQLGINWATALTNNYEYDYTITFNSNNAGTMYMQVPGASNVVTTDSISVVAGENTITGTFVAGTDPAHGKLMMFPEGMADGTIFNFSNVSITRSPQKAAPTGFVATYANEMGDIQFNWTSSVDYTTANLYVDGSLTPYGTITNGQTINVSTFENGTHTNHTFIIEGVTGDSYGTTLKTESITLNKIEQKAAPAGFGAVYDAAGVGDITFSWTASANYNTANLYVDGNLYAGGPITNGQTINVTTFGHAQHTYAIEGVTSDLYSVTERTEGVTLGMVPQKSAPDFTVSYANNYTNVVIDWDAESAIASANLYIDGVEYENNPITRNKTIARSDIGTGNHTFSIIGITSDIYQITTQSDVVTLHNYVYSTTTDNQDFVLSPNSRDGIGNNYSRFHDKSVTASSEGDVFVASNAIDNGVGSRWASVSGLDPQYITVDLQQTRPIKQVELYWETASARDFEIQVSNDGENFTTVATKTSATAGPRYDTIYLIDEAQGRYVRIYGTARNTQYGYSLYDIGIFGSDTDGYINPVPSNLEVTHTYGLEAADDYLSINFECGYGSNATYNVYADFADDGVTGFTLLGNVPASGSRIYGTDSFKIANSPGANRNNQIKITSVYNGVESDYSNTYILHYERELLKSDALGTFTSTCQLASANVAFPATKNEGALNDYTDYSLVTAASSSGKAVNTIDNNVDTMLNSESTDPQWVEVDLKNEYQIKEFDILWSQAKSSDYYIQVSSDGTNFTNAYIVRNASQYDSEDNNKNQRVDNIVLGDMVTARYVRIYGTARDITWRNQHNVREIAIYGPEEDKIGPDMTARGDQELIDPTTIDDNDWVRMNNQLSKTGATAWVTTATKAKMSGVGTVDEGFYAKSQLHSGWNNLAETAMYKEVGNVWGFYPTEHAGDDWDVTGLIINGVDYINPTHVNNKKVLILNNQCIYVNQDIINAEPGETKYYTITVKGNAIDTFIVKVVGADVFSYTIGGDGETPVTYNNDTPGVNVNEFNGIGGYSFSFASRNNGFYKSKTIDGTTYANYLRYAHTSATGTSERQLAGYAIDSVDRQYGNAGTRWESRWDSPYSTGEGITIDLGGIYDVSALDIYWERANAKNFNVQVSEDGTTWKEVFRATKVNANYDTGEVDPNSQNGGHIYRSDRVDSIKLLSDTSARYVKITGTVKNLTTVGEYGYSIWDVAVYGPTPSKFVDNVYAAYLRDEVVYTRWEEVFGADSYRVTLYNSLGNAVSTTTRGSAELASVIDATNLTEGTYTVKVESYDGNTKLGEGTKTVVIDRPQSEATIHENAGIGPYAGGTDSYGATVSYYASIKDVHETPETPENLNLGVTCVSDSGYDYIDVSYNYELTNVQQAVVFADGKQVTAADGVIEWDGQKLQINETKIPEGTITTYDIYLTNAHVRLVVTKGEITSSQVAEIFKSPTDLTVHAGDPYTFSGSAGGSNVTYQWQYQDGVGEWTNIDGATLTSVEGVGKMTINGRKFRFIAQAHAANGTNYGRAVTSNAATLTVLPRVVEGLELRNDDGDVIAQWPAVDGATGYTLQYTYDGNTITVDNLSAETLTYDFTSAYTADATKGYPDNGSTVTVTPTGTGSPMQVTALADLYVVSVEVNDGAALVAGETYDSVLVMKNKGTAWVDITTSNFTATASTTGWTPTITGTTKEKFLPDMVDSHSLTYTGFRPASAGEYTINYAINTKLEEVAGQQVHVITEGTWVPEVNPYANNSKSVSVTVAAEPPTIKVDSSKAGVQGFQIRTNQGEDMDDDRFDGTVAFRTVCRAPAVGQTFTARDGRTYTVANVGIIYSIDSNTSGYSKDMTITAANTILDPTPVNEQYKYQYKYQGKGDNASITKGYIATQAAVLETANGYSTYAITMQDMNALMANSMLVRSFIVATDGTIIYSTKLVKVSIAEIAEYMYYNSLCNNDNGHQYLYDEILHSTTLRDANEGNNRYYRTETVEYGWNSTIYDKLPN